MAATLADNCAQQTRALLLAPGSTSSLFAIFCSFAAATLFLHISRPSSRLLSLASLKRIYFPRWLIRHASSQADIIYLLFSLIGFALMFGWALFSFHLVGAAVRDVLVPLLGDAPLRTTPHVVVIAIATIALFLAYEFSYWYDHYLSHKIPLLWAFHRVHHSAEVLSPITNFRVHPVDTIVFYAITALIMGATEGVLQATFGRGASDYLIGTTNILLFFTAIFWTHLHHSHLWIVTRGRWNQLLLSPGHHQIHHSADPRHHDKNFGNCISIWDKLFGTLHMPEAKREALTFGVPCASGNPHGWHAALIEPFAEAWHVIWPSSRRHADGLRKSI